MIRGRLHRRGRAENTPNQPRAEQRRLGRVIYLVLVVSFFGFMANALFGSLLFLRSSGVVLAQTSVVATAFVARVERLEVRAGEIVREGQVVGLVKSPEMLDTIARLTNQVSQLVLRRTQVAGRLHILDQLLPLTAERRSRAAQAVSRVADASRRNVTSTTFDLSAMREIYDAEREHAALQAEQETLQNEAKVLDEQLAPLQLALEAMGTSYSDGVLRAPGDGMVGARLPHAGAVLKPGDAVMSIYTGVPYVLAYLPSGVLYEVHQGEEVVVTDGTTSVRGYVERLEEVADYLPIEFQTAFRPTEKQQMMRIRLHEGSSQTFPVEAKVYVTSRWGPAYLGVLFRQVMALISDGLRGERSDEGVPAPLSMDPNPLPTR